MIKIEYRPNETDLPSYGSWECPKCKRKMYSGGEFRHAKSCMNSGHKDCIFFFGPSGVETDSDSLLPSGVTRLMMRDIVRKFVEDNPPYSKAQDDPIWGRKVP